MDRYRLALIVAICAFVFCLVVMPASAQTAGTSAIKGVIFNDTNKDGLHQITEPGIPGITVDLMAAGGIPVASLVTDHNGYFNFTGLAAGQYAVYIVLPPDYTYSTVSNVAVNLVDNSLGKVCMGIYYVYKPPFDPRTIGYWKNHPEAVAPLLPAWLGMPGGPDSVRVGDIPTAISILGQSGGASNGIVKLKAQLLATKLDIAAGADSSGIAGKVSAADAFLAYHDAASWNSLSSADKQYVLSLKDAFDAFNNSGE